MTDTDLKLHRIILHRTSEAIAAARDLKRELNYLSQRLELLESALDDMRLAVKPDQD